MGIFRVNNYKLILKYIACKVELYIYEWDEHLGDGRSMIVLTCVILRLIWLQTHFCVFVYYDIRIANEYK